MLDRPNQVLEAAAMQVVETPEQLADFHRCALVPTMGALHAGHRALIRQAAQSGRPVVVSVFVNPTQFGPREDFASYPRQLDRDVAQASDAGAAAIFAPRVETMYPKDQSVEAPPLPPVATEPGLEDRARPDHFRGVCQVVARLLDLVKPAFAIFGEKDYQQLLVIRAMAKCESARWGELAIVAVPTVREPDGLAKSSRNVHLAGAERDQALGLRRALDGAAQSTTPSEAEARMAEVLKAHGLTVDYAVVRNAETLMPIESFDRPARALVAARVGSVRLIDNAAIPSTP